MNRRLPPSVDFYYDDFLSGTIGMHPIAVAMYIKLICHQLGTGGFRDNKRLVLQVCGVTSEEYDEHWPEVREKFEEQTDGLLVNRRAQSEMDKKVALIERNRRNGQKGGRPKANENPGVTDWDNPEANPGDNPKKTSLEEGSRKREVGSRKGEAGSRKSEVGSQQEQVEIVIEHYQDRHPKAKPGSAERKKIQARLSEGFTVEDLTKAIDGCHLSPWHSGENEQGKKYQSLELIVRDSAKVNEFMSIAEDPPKPKPPVGERTSINAGALKEYLEGGGEAPW